MIHQQLSKPLPEKAAPFLERIEQLCSNRASEKATSMQRCSAIADDIKEVYKEAKAAGVEVKPLRAVVKRRTLEGQIEALPAEFELDELAQYSTLVDAFGTTPMGEWMNSHRPRQHQVIDFGGITGADLDVASDALDKSAKKKRKPASAAAAVSDPLSAA